MNILILNWRDSNNPKKGGAEVLTYELAKRWVQRGHRVLQISERFPGSSKKEEIDGVTVIRLGRWWNIHLFAALYYIFRLRNSIDIIIDEVHWFPFFSYLYAPSKTILLACETATKLFPVILPRFLARLMVLFEKGYFQIYRNVPTFAISPSTQNDLLSAGFTSVTVIPMGFNKPSYVPRVTKDKNPTLIYVGRLNKQKGAEDAIVAFLKARQRIPSLQLWLVGRGTPHYTRKLQQKVKHVEQEVKFWGFVAQAKKFELMKKAHILVSPSLHEGWGLVVLEAGYMGTPAVVYNVSGLKDLVKNGKNGWVTDPNPQALAHEIVKVLLNPINYEHLSKSSEKEVQQYSWNNTAEFTYSAMRKMYEKNSGRAD